MKSLERSLGLFAVVAISVGAMLGGAIFLLPAVAAELTGPSLWLAYLVAALLVLHAALSKAELATAMPDSGGAYLYIERAMGPLAGTVAGIGLWLSLLLKSTFALAVLGNYLSLVVEVPLTPVGLALLALVTALNVVGVRRVSAIQKYVVGACLFALSRCSSSRRCACLRTQVTSRSCPEVWGGLRRRSASSSSPMRASPRSRRSPKKCATSLEPSPAGCWCPW